MSCRRLAEETSRRHRLRIVGSFAVLVFCSSWSADVRAEPIELTAVERADDAVDLSINAVRDAERSLRSAVGVAVYERYVQAPGDAEETLRTRAKIRVYFAGDRYHLRFAFDKRLIPTVVDSPDGGRVRKLLDWKPDDLLIICDGRKTDVVTIADRIKPDGLRVQVYDKLDQACSLHTDLRSGELARLWRSGVNFTALVKNLGRDAIKVSETSDKRYLATYRVKNAPKIRVLVSIDPKCGFHVDKRRIINPDGRPARTDDFEWKKSGEIWYVAAHEQTSVSRLEAGRVEKSRTSIRFESFEPNAPVDAKMFSRLSVGVRGGIRSFDD